VSEGTIKLRFESDVKRRPVQTPKGQGHLSAKSLQCCSRWCARTTQKSLRFLCWKHTKVVLPGGRAVVHCRTSP